MADAQKRGIDIVLRRVVPFSFSAKLPDLQPQQVETLVNGISIRKEQYSTTRYIATLDVSFNEQAVKQLLASLGIPTSEERAPIDLDPAARDRRQQGEERSTSPGARLGSISTSPTG